jgi:hypothetical protein
MCTADVMKLYPTMAALLIICDINRSADAINKENENKLKKW